MLHHVIWHIHKERVKLVKHLLRARLLNNIARNCNIRFLVLEFCKVLFFKLYLSVGDRFNELLHLFVLGTFTSLYSTHMATPFTSAIEVITTAPEKATPMSKAVASTTRDIIAISSSVSEIIPTKDTVTSPSPTSKEPETEEPETEEPKTGNLSLKVLRNWHKSNSITC